MMPALWPVMWRWGLPPLAAIGAVYAAWAIDRGSLERANRLYRAEDYLEAARIYADHLGRNPGKEATARLRYNLGTALLGLGDGGAVQALAAVDTAAGVEVQTRALNNLGLWHFIEAAKALGQGRARDHALRSIDAYKAALRLQPGHEDASWNLAIALRMLASIDAGDYQQGGDPTETGEKPKGERPPSDDSGDPAEQEDAAEAGPKVGEGETAAKAAEDISLSPDRAAEILSTNHRDPTAMVGKLMASEGRSLRERASGRKLKAGR